MEDFDGNSRYAKYSLFSVGDENSEFELTVLDYSGNAGKLINMKEFELITMLHLTS